MYRRIQPHAEEQEQNAIERLGHHSAEEGPLGTGLCPTGTEDQHDDEESVDNGDYHCSALPHSACHSVHHLGYAQAKDEADLGVKNLQDRIHAREKCDGEKPSPHRAACAG